MLELLFLRHGGVFVEVDNETLRLALRSADSFALRVLVGHVVFVRERDLAAEHRLALGGGVHSAAHMEATVASG